MALPVRTTTGALDMRPMSLRGGLFGCPQQSRGRSYAGDGRSGVAGRRGAWQRWRRLSAAAADSALTQRFAQLAAALAPDTTLKVRAQNLSIHVFC